MRLIPILVIASMSSFVGCSKRQVAVVPPAETAGIDEAPVQEGDRRRADTNQKGAQQNDRLITKIVGRHQTVIITKSASGPLYTVQSSAGEVLITNLSQA